MPAEDDPKSPIGRSFYNTYQVSTKEEVEEKLDAIQGLEYHWLEDGSLQVISEPVPSVRFIEEQYFHSIYQHTL